MVNKLLATIDIGSQYTMNGREIKAVFPTVGSFFSVLLFNVYTIIGIILIFILIFGGINLIIGSQGDKGATAKGKAAITSAIAGFFIVVFSYFIIQLIQTITGVNILNPSI